MGLVNTMAFITHCCTSRLPDDAGRGWPRRDLSRLHALLALALLMFASLSWAQATASAVTTSSVELTELRLDRADKTVVLNTAMRLELGSALEDALLKGVAIHFVAQIDLYRDRWYWSDERVVTAARYYRLVYQPLTRRWRLNTSREPLSSSALGNSLSQNFDSLTEALALVRRVYGWPVTEVAELSRGQRYNLRYQFRLDVNQLPRPFQISTETQSDWNLGVSRELRLPAELLP